MLFVLFKLICTILLWIICIAAVYFFACTSIIHQCLISLYDKQNILRSGYQRYHGMQNTKMILQQSWAIYRYSPYSLLNSHNISSKFYPFLLTCTSTNSREQTYISTAWVVYTGNLVSYHTRHIDTSTRSLTAFHLQYVVKWHRKKGGGGSARAHPLFLGAQLGCSLGYQDLKARRAKSSVKPMSSQ